jgi:hypothetical protein
MTDDQKARLRAVLMRQRAAHQKLFDLQSGTIAALREAVEAVARTQDEMAKLFQADSDAEDIIEGE